MVPDLLVRSRDGTVVAYGRADFQATGRRAGRVGAILSFAVLLIALALDSWWPLAFLPITLAAYLSGGRLAAEGGRLSIDPEGRTVGGEGFDAFGAVFLERIVERYRSGDETVARHRYRVSLVRRGKEDLAGRAARISIRLQEAASGRAPFADGEQARLRAEAEELQPLLPDGWIRLTEHSDPERVRRAAVEVARILDLPILDHSGPDRPGPEG